jgi:hypothetical protein
MTNNMNYLYSITSYVQVQRLIVQIHGVYNKE